MKIFITGATGYIGGSIAATMRDAGHEVVGLVRSDERANQAIAEGIKPIMGSLDDPDVLARAATRVEAVINCASSDHRGAVEAMLGAMEGTDKLFVHTSGTSIVGYPDEGEERDGVYDEDTPFTPSPGRVERVRINDEIIEAARRGIHTVILCPCLIYGEGLGVNKDSMQVPWLLDVARKFGVAKHIGSGGNIWSNVHIQDLAALYLLAMEKAPPGSFYFAENGANAMREVCAAINVMMGVDGLPQSMSIEEASAEWGEGPAHHTMGSNSRVFAKRAREDLGWMPSAPSLLDEITGGCYAGGA